MKISKELQRAREFEAEHRNDISEEERPAFHVTGVRGWINDPNGFSYYKGECHLFHQYHPYSNVWGPMHWGHLKSKDMITWERLPVALAPDQEPDAFGCFSGSALELEDGRHLLMYTGVKLENGLEGGQTQCLAFGDGINYEKYEGNPVIDTSGLPEGSSARDFRDPKIWREEDGTYFAVVASEDRDKNGQIALYRSQDLYSWQFCSILEKSCERLQRIWECPDLFKLEDQYVLLVNPMSMIPDGEELHAGSGTVAILGSFDREKYTFTREKLQLLDGGIDFYAPQTVETPDGRRIMIGWMQAWTNSKFVPEPTKFFGQLSVPRELTLREGRLIQTPVRELLNYRGERVLHENVEVTGQKLALAGVRGRVLDMTVTIRELEELEMLTIHVAEDEAHHTSVSYEPKKCVLRLDRTHSGYYYDILHSRDMKVYPKRGELKLQFVMDRCSLEIFINDGEQVGTVTLFTAQEADGISFFAQGRAVVDVEKYELNF